MCEFVVLFGWVMLKVFMNYCSLCDLFEFVCDVVGWVELFVVELCLGSLFDGFDLLVLVYGDDGVLGDVLV